jgi:predicted transcriptional regulator
VSRQQVAPSELRGLVAAAFDALSSLYDQGNAASEPDMPKPRVEIAASITPDFIVCLEDGKRFKSLKRHIRTHYDLSPEEYRRKWGLPSDYPMVAPNYAMARSGLAKRMRLGHRRKA